jgi:D-alanine transaminase
MLSLACLNGEIMPVEEAKVPVWDRGFLFGDSIYEVCRLYQGKSWLEAAHMARLRRSLQEMLFPALDVESLRDRAGRTISASGVSDGTLYIQVTRGVAPRKHTFPGPEVPPTELIIVRPYDDSATQTSRESGVGVISQPDLRWRRCDVKSTNLLANVVACEVAHRAGCLEAVLVEDSGLVTEATHSSLLWVRDGTLQATPEGEEILPGTTRHHLLALAESAGIPFREDRVTLDELKQADEVILTGTTIEIMPVVTIDGEMVGGGLPGPWTRRLQAAFRESVNTWLAGAEQPELAGLP